MNKDDVLKLKTGDVVYVWCLFDEFGNIASIPPAKFVITVVQSTHSSRQVVKIRDHNKEVELATFILGDVSSVDILKTFHLNIDDANRAYNLSIYDKVDYHKEQIKKLKKSYTHKVVKCY